MSFKISLVLLLTVAVFACFSTEDGIVEFAEAPADGDEIAFQLAQDYIDEGEFDLILGQPEPLFGCGYDGSYIAYMIFADPQGEVKNMGDYQAIIRELRDAASEYSSFAEPIIEYNLNIRFREMAGEEVLEETISLEGRIPEDVLIRFRLADERRRE